MLIFSTLYLMCCAIALAMRLRLYLEWQEDTYRLKSAQKRLEHNIRALTDSIEVCESSERENRESEVEKTRVLIAEAKSNVLKGKVRRLRAIVGIGFAWNMTIAVCVVALPFYWLPAVISLAIYVLVGFVLFPVLQRNGLKSVNADYDRFDTEMMSAEVRLLGGEPML